MNKRGRVLVLVILFAIFLLINTLGVSAFFAENATWEANLSIISSKSDFILGDVDGDGDLDLFHPGAVTRLYLNNGTSFRENLSWTENVSLLKSGEDFASALFADFNGDAKLDLLIAGEDVPAGTNFQIEICLNNGTAFDCDYSWSSSIYAVDGGGIDVGDIDNDGDLDLVIAGDIGESGDNFSTKVYLNNGSGFVEDLIWQQNLLGLSMGSTELVDFDNDNNLDLLLVGADDDSFDEKVRVYLSNGSTFIESAQWQENLNGAYYNGLAGIGDFDSDGDIDLAISGSYDSGFSLVRIYINNGTSFQENLSWSQNMTEEFTANCLALGDLDNDGDLDLFSSGSIPKIYLNNGSAFQVNESWTANLSQSSKCSASLGDIDGDKDLDLVVFSGSSITSSKVYINNQTGGANTVPTAPSNFDGAYDLVNNILSFNWTQGIDTETSDIALYYNFKVGTTSGGNDIVSGSYGGTNKPSTNGFLGNMLLSREKNLSLSSLTGGTTYFWSVQTIDAGYEPSLWSTENNISIPLLNASLQLPSTNSVFSVGTSFIITSNVSCSNGDCGNISAFLDPVSKSDFSLVNFLVSWFGLFIFVLFGVGILLLRSSFKEKIVLFLIFIFIFVGLSGILNSGITGFAGGSLVSTVVGTVPVYTNASNPQNCNVMNSSNSFCVNNWNIFTTGTSSDLEFYVIYNNSDFTSQTDSVFVNITSIPAVHTGGSAGAGGGSVISSQEVSVSDSASFSLFMGQIDNFDFGGARHSIRLKTLSKDEVTIIIQSRPIEITLIQGQSENIDIDFDGVEDIEVRLNKLNFNRAQISISVVSVSNSVIGTSSIVEELDIVDGVVPIIEEPSVIEESSVIESPISEDGVVNDIVYEKTKKVNNFAYFIIIILIVIAFIIFFELVDFKFLKKRKK